MQDSQQGSLTEWERDLREFCSYASTNDAPDVSPFAAFTWNPEIAHRFGFPVCAECGFPHGRHAYDCDFGGVRRLVLK